MIHGVAYTLMKAKMQSEMQNCSARASGEGILGRHRYFRKDIACKMCDSAEVENE